MDLTILHFQFPTAAVIAVVYVNLMMQFVSKQTDVKPPVTVVTSIPLSQRKKTPLDSDMLSRQTASWSLWEHPTSWDRFSQQQGLFPSLAP